MSDLVSFAQTRKFWVAVFGAVVTYLSVKFGQSPELSLFTGLLTAAGVYGTPNES